MRACPHQQWHGRTHRHSGSRYPSAVRAVAVLSADPFGSVTPQRGFLPQQDPLQSLPGAAFDTWEHALAEVPKLAVVAGQGQLRAALLDLPPFPLAELGLDSSSTMPWPPAAAAAPAGASGAQGADEPAGASAVQPGSRELWRAYQLLAFLAHAYCWCDGLHPPPLLPARLAQPWVAVSAALDMPPVLTYTTYNLLNWRQLPAAGCATGAGSGSSSNGSSSSSGSSGRGGAGSAPAGLALGHMVCLNNFLGGPDEEWFRLVHLAIEATAAPAMAALAPLQVAAAQQDWAGVEAGLEEVAAALRRMRGLLGRMPERCDPYIYYNRVRLPMSGWRSNPALPHGLLYEGVWPAPVQLYGETGAQSSILHAIDAALGVQHTCGWLRDYLTTMHLHMPPAHRAFIAALEPSGPLLRAALSSQAPAAAQEGYNAVLAELEAFRGQHKVFARDYIAQWAPKGKEEKGTGGSDFMPALGAYKATTAAHKL